MKLSKIFGLLSIMLVATEISLACSCSESTASENFLRADAVFLGKVIEINQTASPTLFTLEVEKSWKGLDTAEAIIPSGRADCDIDFKLNEHYIVYARNYEGRLTTGKCAGSLELLSANRQLEDLRNRPTIPIAHPEQRSYSWVIYVIVASVLISLLIVSLALKGRKRAAS